MPDVVCLGILVADAIARPVEGLPEHGALALVEEVSLHGGGCALNTASVLSRLGLEAAAAGKVGDDAFGDFLLGLLDERGVDRSRVLRDPEAPTSGTAVLVDAAGERTFLHSVGANGALRPDELDLDFLLSGRALHVAGAFLLPGLDGEPTAALLRAARARGILTSLDTAWDASGRWEGVLPALPHLDLVTPSLAEGRGITGEQEAAAVAGRLRELGVAVAAVKLGAEGCYVAAEGFEGLVRAPDVEVVDGTGSGDAFAAGFLYARLEGWPLERSARFANAVGALATTAVGAVEGVTGRDDALALAGA